MATRADGPIAALRAGHEELTSFAAQLSAHDLERLSAADEWTVAQVLSHLGSSAEIGLATLDAALAGSAAPGAGFNEQVWDRWNHMTAQEQAESFSRTNDALVSRYEGLDEATRNELTIDLGFLPDPLDVAASAALRLGEFTYHTWDVQVVFDPSAVLAPGAVEYLFQPLNMLIGFLGNTEVLNGKQASLAVLTDRHELSLGLQLEDAVALTDAPAHHDGVLQIPAEAMLRLTVGRLSPEHTPAGTRLSSDIVSLDELRKVFPGF